MSASANGNIAVCGYLFSGVEWVHNIITKLLTPYSCHDETAARAHVSCCTGYLPTQTSLPQSLPQRTVLVIRNPKDVYAAIYKSLGNEPVESFESFVSNSLLCPYTSSGTGSWFDYTEQWEMYLRQHTDSHFHIVYFNRLIKDFPSEIWRLCRSLNITLDEEQIPELCSRLSLDNLITDEPQRKRQRTNAEVAWRSDRSLYEMDIWKHLFLVQFSQTFDIIFRDKLKNSIFDLHAIV